MLCQLLALSLLALAVAAQSTPPQILVYTKTAGYYHESIPAASEAIRQIGQRTSLFNATISNDEGLFTTEGLAPFKLIAFLSNSDQVLTDEGETALTQWLTTGGSLVGLHAGSACLFNDTAFGTALGSWFDYHPDLQNVTFTKVTDHPTVAMLPERYTYVEEAHHFRTDPRSVNCTVLLSYDESSVDDPQAGTRPYFQGSPPPIAWFREGQSVDLSNGTAGAEPAVMTGRTWFTSLGHTTAFWQDELNLQHIEAGLRWALQDFTSSNSSSTSSNPSSSSSTSASSGASPASTSSSAVSSPTSDAPTLSSLHSRAFILYALIAFVALAYSPL
ncbi:hypothetical protein JCM10449v2_001114 [Rhodotorula kratochvilovae]